MNPLSETSKVKTMVGLVALYALTAVFAMPTDAYAFPAKNVPILMYHKVDERTPSTYWVSLHNFRDQAFFLQDQGYTSVDLDDLYDHVKGIRELPAKPVIITCDDGYDNVYAHAMPLLAERGLFGVSNCGPTNYFGDSEPNRLSNTWDVAAEYYCPQLIWPEVTALYNGGWSISAHGQLHKSLSTMTDAEKAGEVASRHVLATKAGIPTPNFYSYPFGSSDANFIQRLKNDGYLGALNASGGMESTTRLEADPNQLFLIRRTGVNKADTLAIFAGYVGGTVPSKPVLTANSVGNGSVIQNPDQPYYNVGTVVNLTAVPDPGYTFSAWSGALTGSTNPTTITMDASKTVTATFVLAGTMPFSDGFESGGTTHGGWTAPTGATASTTQSYTGTYSLRLVGGTTTTITKAQSTAGYNTIHVKYDRHFVNTTSVTMVVDWSVDGINWNVLETATVASGTAYAQWVSKDFTCASGADNNTGFRIRFRTTAGASTQYVYIDNVQITSNSPTAQATTPNPATGATGVSITADLSWTAGSGATSHDVYFGTDSTPDETEFKGNQAGTTYDPNTMSNNTTYYWRIDEKNAGGTTTGIVWSFTTVPAAPAQAGSPSPADLATNVGVTTDLGWTAGSGATSHIVYFGTSSPGTLRGEQAGTAYDTGTMSANTTYYWRIDEKNAGGTTTGTVWSFTTQTAPPALPWSDGFESGNLTTGGWTPAGTASVTTAAAYTGTYGAYIPGGGSSSITKSLSTVGFTAIYVKYDRRLTHNGATLVVDWSTDGSTWYVLETLTGSTAWASPNLLCAAGADNNAGFRVRFRVTSTNGGRHAYIDNVQITGTVIPSTTTVPNVVGQTQAAAATAITGAGLIVGTVTNAYSDTVAAGLVISQAPAGGTVVNVGSAVNLVISLGKPIVPNVVGMTQAAATAAITAVDNLTVGTVTTAYSNTVAAGLVISQNPVGGTQVNIGSAVNLVISLGRPVVPNVVGMTQAAATAAITAVDNLTVGTVTTAYSDTVAAGLVISQNPAGGTQVNTGSAVDMVVSLGLPLIPDVTGQAQAAAEAAIVAATFTVGAETTAYSDTVAAGLVISQNPAGGTAATSGTAVDMVISLGSAPRIISGYITEPDVNIPVEGVVVNANNGGGSDTTDVNGFYDLQVSYGWSGAVDVNKTGYTFEPNGIDYNNVTTDQTNQDYIATLLAYVISGYVLDSNDSSPIDGVLMSGLPGDPCTNGSGYYSAVVDYGWSGTVTPTKYAYAFEPNSIEYTNVIADQTAQDYAGTLLTYSISGCILDLNDIPIDGVLVSADNGGGLDTTDPNGYYEVWVSYNWSGAVTPTDEEYTFAPANRPYSNVLADQTNQDYVGTSIYDLYPDGIIDLLDLDVLCENWLTTGPGDLDNDGNVDFTDYAKFALVW